MAFALPGYLMGRMGAGSELMTALGLATDGIFILYRRRIASVLWLLLAAKSQPHMGVSRGKEIVFDIWAGSSKLPLRRCAARHEAGFLLDPLVAGCH